MPPILRPLQHSSGDLLADRRAAYAESLAESGDFAAAADLMRQALELAPAWTAGWSRLGDYCERGGDLDGALAAWRRVEALDRAGIFGADLKLAAHGMAPIVTSTPTAYVEALFDDYAGRFETALLQRLHYEAPRELATRIVETLETRGLVQLARAVDLGCGTGLMGEHLRHVVSFLEGVDLSAGMIEESQRKGIYDRLEQAELTAFLGQHTGQIDLLTAADVFNYCGALPPVLAGAAQALRPGGLLGFTLEAHGGPEPMVLRPSLRFAHETGATRSALAAAGFEILRFDEAVLRFDRGEPVAGYLVVAAKAAPAKAVTADLAEAAAGLPLAVH